MIMTRKGLTNYKITDLISNSGSLGEVLEANSFKNPKLFITVKILNTTKWVKSDINEITEAYKSLRHLHHPNMAYILNVTANDNEVLVIMENIKGRSLQDLLFELELDDDRMAEKDTAELTKYILRAVAYIHSKKIIHKNIKPSNIVFKEIDDVTKLKLVDFGFAMNYSSKRGIDKWCPDTTHLAPEVYNKNIYTNSADVWSLGMIAYQLLTGGESLIWRETDGNDEKQIIYPSYFSKLSIHFLDRLLKWNHSERYSAEEALLHPWITRTYTNNIPLTMLEKMSSLSIKDKLIPAVKVLYFLSKFTKRPTENRYWSKLKNLGTHVLKWHKTLETNFTEDGDYVLEAKAPNYSSAQKANSPKHVLIRRKPRIMVDQAFDTIQEDIEQEMLVKYPNKLQLPIKSGENSPNIKSSMKNIIPEVPKSPRRMFPDVQPDFLMKGKSNISFPTSGKAYNSPESPRKSPSPHRINNHHAHTQEIIRTSQGMAALAKKLVKELMSKKVAKIKIEDTRNLYFSNKLDSANTPRGSKMKNKIELGKIKSPTVIGNWTGKINSLHESIEPMDRKKNNSKLENSKSNNLPELKSRKIKSNEFIMENLLKIQKNTRPLPPFLQNKYNEKLDSINSEEISIDQRENESPYEGIFNLELGTQPSRKFKFYTPLTLLRGEKSKKTVRDKINKLIGGSARRINHKISTFSERNSPRITPFLTPRTLNINTLNSINNISKSANKNDNSIKLLNLPKNIRINSREEKLPFSNTKIRKLIDKPESETPRSKLKSIFSKNMGIEKEIKDKEYIWEHGNSLKVESHQLSINLPISLTPHIERKGNRMEWQDLIINEKKVDANLLHTPGVKDGQIAINRKGRKIPVKRTFQMSRLTGTNDINYYKHDSPLEKLLYNKFI